MKKIICLLLGIALITGLSSCENDESPMPRNPNVAFVVELVPDNWERVSNSLIKADIPLKDLTDYYMDQGGVSVALSFDNEQTYDILPATFGAYAYSVNYTTGWITIFAEDPLADDEIIVEVPENNVVAKIILTETDYLEYQGIFNDPASDKIFTPIHLN